MHIARIIYLLNSLPSSALQKILSSKSLFWVCLSHIYLAYIIIFFIVYASYFIISKMRHIAMKEVMHFKMYKIDSLLLVF